ncbi:hypothetical protein CLIB1444_03S08350 [[Candida] jaroonii]|uniref:Uncharacterized protein n=1 Tax=[Candida] jaroonii TaxID=467808 RepID=A0ACA9Y5L5_9ASCO|nr:hypothetical protein CLIB1444_03S08350 [[Candida] jaroonii]
MQVMLDKDVVYADSWSYRHMCRWYTGFFYKHPLLEKYEYYWRLEPGVRLLCDVEYDVFLEMYNKNKKYAFTLTLFEYSDTIPSLWTHFKAFKDSHQYNGQLLDLIEDGDNYNLCHFWSNFEIASLDIFQSAEYEEFFRFMDQTGGFFYERWGDAPLHTLFIALYLNKEDLWYLNDFGYYHAPYLQCPPDDIGQRCICDQDYDFTYSFQSCTSHFLKIIESK